MNDVTSSIKNFDKVVTNIQAMAKAGSSPSCILHFLTSERGIEEKVQLLALFRHAFGVGLEKVVCIGGWSPDGESELSDAKIDEYLTPVIDEYCRI